eukprot:TRINITY_DN5820_c0_g1_i6.p5 TRINITY_DN5820_c0_g1~~TRINITY_DN5820_c0_g1_i6.p5  ORF type:complete len:170 (-),score=0.34 TRINITY_DN5820_c0_g1_i6:679-1188(-)
MCFFLFDNDESFICSYKNNNEEKDYVFGEKQSVHYKKNQRKISVTENERACEESFQREKRERQTDKCQRYEKRGYCLLLFWFLTRTYCRSLLCRLFTNFAHCHSLKQSKKSGRSGWVGGEGGRIEKRSQFINRSTVFRNVELVRKLFLCIFQLNQQFCYLLTCLNIELY